MIPMELDMDKTIRFLYYRFMQQRLSALYPIALPKVSLSFLKNGASGATGCALQTPGRRGLASRGRNRLVRSRAVADNVGGSVRGLR
jgi:hypothetical protein